MNTQIINPEVQIESQPLKIEVKIEEPNVDEVDEQEAIAVDPNQDGLETSTVELSDDDLEPA